MNCPICGLELEEKFEVSLYWTLFGLSEDEKKLVGKSFAYSCPCSSHDDIGWCFLYLNEQWFVWSTSRWKRLLDITKEKVMFT